MASASTTEVFLDTSAWLLAVTEPTRQTPPLGNARILGSLLLLAEVASLVGRGRVPGLVLERLATGSRLEPPTAEDYVAAGRLHGRLRLAGDRKVSLNDCIMYQSARRLGVPFVTADGDLADQPGVVHI